MTRPLSPLTGVPKPTKLCLICEKEVAVTNFERHVAAHKKGTGDLMKAGNGAEDKPATKPKPRAPVVPRIEDPEDDHDNDMDEMDEVASPRKETTVAVPPPPTVAASVEIHSILAERPVDYADCPHCDGVLIFGKDTVDHVDDLRTFLRAVARSLSIRTTARVDREVRPATLAPDGAGIDGSIRMSEVESPGDTRDA